MLNLQQILHTKTKLTFQDLAKRGAKRASISAGPGLVLGPKEILHFLLSNIFRLFVVLFFQVSSLHLCQDKKNIFNTKVLAIFSKYIIAFLNMRNQGSKMFFTFNLQIFEIDILVLVSPLVSPRSSGIFLLI